MEISGRDSAPDWLGIFREEAPAPSTDPRLTTLAKRALDRHGPRATRLSARSPDRDLGALTEHARRARRRVASLFGSLPPWALFLSGVVIGGLLTLAVRDLPSMNTATPTSPVNAQRVLAQLPPANAAPSFAGPPSILAAGGFAGPPLDTATPAAPAADSADATTEPSKKTTTPDDVSAQPRRRVAARPAPARNRAARSVAHRGSLTVASQPDGASVFLNGQLAGKTPLVLRNIAVGSRAVRVVKSHYRPWSGVVRIVGNRRASIKATLELAPVGEDAPPSDEVASRIP